MPLSVLKVIARTVRTEHEQHAVPADHIAARPVNCAAPLAIVDGSNLAWARTTDDGLPSLDNLKLVRTALAESGYQALVVVDAALRVQLGGRDASELDPQIAGQDVIQAPSEIDGDQWVVELPPKPHVRLSLYARCAILMTHPQPWLEPPLRRKHSLGVLY